MSFTRIALGSRAAVAGLIAAAMFTAAGCSMSDLVSTDLPASSTDPNAVNTPQGALDRYNAAIMQFRTVTSGRNSGSEYIRLNALFADELSAGQYNTPGSGNFTAASVVDSRSFTGRETDGTLAGPVNGVWSGLSAVRTISQDAMNALATYNPSAPPDLTGHLYAMRGYAETMLAELYCSGVPLSSLKPGGGFVYGNALSTQQLLEHAVAQFDTALAMIKDSASFINFARVGKGRALLGLGRYDEAKQAVANVPTSFAYNNLHSLTPAGAIGVANFTVTRGVMYGYGTMGDNEGGNGLDFVSAMDPRVTWKDTVETSSTWPATNVKLPSKWAVPNASAPVTIANGIEARLIEAEAALKAGGGTWLTILNELRTTCQTAGACVTPAPAGTGGVAGLPPLTDPGTQDARVDLLFRERAFWLYLTGHRVGDLRRLVRQYGRSANAVFPVGTYPAGPLGNYGIDVNLPAPYNEIANNPNYSGCINRDA